LCHELSLTGLRFEREKALPVRYRDVLLDCGYRIDVLVEDSVVLELKTVEAILPIHAAQVLTYLKLSGLRLGLLINFNVKLLRHGIRRLIL